MREVVIRPITRQDVEGYAALIGVVARERRWLTLLDAPSLEDTRTFVVGNLAAGYPHLVAELDGEIVGWCDVTRRSSRAVFAHCGTLGVGLHPETRGRGLGRRLVGATIDAAWEFGFLRVDLTARADNIRAIRLYESLGFRQEGRFHRRYLLDGAYHDELAMALFPPQAVPDPSSR